MKLEITATATLCCALTSCMGTMQSRVAPYDGRLLGWPLYSGVLSDFDVIVNGYPSCRAELGTFLTYLSLPLDFVIDTVLAVPDLCAGVAGWTKGDRYPEDLPDYSPEIDPVSPNTTQQPTGAPSGAGG